MKTKEFKCISVFSITLLWALFVYLTRGFRDINEVLYEINICVSFYGIYIVIAYILDWPMWFSGFKTPSMKENPSEDNRYGRIFGLFVGVILLFVGVWFMYFPP